LERTIALAHWKNTCSTAILSTQRGALPCMVKLAHSSGSVEMVTRPMTRSVSLTPGMRNSSATRGSVTRLRRLSMRLLPRRSGTTTVFSSSTRTKPLGSPRGEQSSPPGPLVAIAQNGEASISA
jgi:hypothetical protein